MEGDAGPNGPSIVPIEAALSTNLEEVVHLSLHGETAAKRQAITELLFFCSVGDVHRAKKITGAWGLSLVDPKTADYDKRTPLHLSAAEGCYSIVSWLISQKADVNPVDRFNRTPLEDAVRGDYGEVASLLIQHGAKVVNKEGEMVDLADSPLAGNVRLFNGYDPEWEIDPNSVKMLEQIGEGEFGVVYKAKWHGTIVAVKILKDFGAMAMGDFRTELNVLQKVHHPHNVQFLGAVTKSQPYMIVTEFMTGGSLLDLFKGKRRVSFWRSIQLCMDCARGMAYLHNRSPHAVVHRDLKPANVMLGGPKVFTSFHTHLLQDETGVLKIADFGLSKSLKLAKIKRKTPGDASERSERNHKESEAGTPTGDATPNATPNATPTVTPSYKLTGETGSYRYMAPEVFRHEQYNNKVDVYSFAMICYQLFEGIAPFADQHPVDAARAAAVDHRRPTWGPAVPSNPMQEKVRRLVEACWSADPDARPEFEEIVDRLETICRDVKATVSTQAATKENNECCTVQ